MIYSDFTPSVMGGGWVGIFAKQPLFCQKEPIINWVVLQMSDSAKAIVHYCLKDTAAYMYIIKTCLPISTQQYVLLYLYIPLTCSQREPLTVTRIDSNGNRILELSFILGNEHF